MLIIDNKKLHDWIQQKDEIVNEGRGVSKKIEDLEVKIKRFEVLEKRLTGKVKPSKELADRGDELVKQITKLNNELEKLANSIDQEKLATIPPKMKEDHLKLLADKEVLERDRNKLALKVQKIKDRIIPLVQKTVKPLLDDPYDDIETAKVKDGKVMISTFNHLEEFRKKFKH